MDSEIQQIVEKISINLRQVHSLNTYLMLQSTVFSFCVFSDDGNVNIVVP